MLEILTLGLFSIGLIVCLIFDWNILFALGFGFLLFFTYGLIRKFKFRQIWKMAINGVKKVKNILLTFLLIGMLTALWRASGTVSAIICYSSGFLKPSVFLLASFLLNCLVSFLTGTSFGTVATMGVICMTMGNAMQLNPVLTAGTILSGIFFGDRCSPVSTSALLVSEVTNTDIYDNIKKMMKTALVPLVLSCIIYLVLGFFMEHGSERMDVWALFEKEFVIHFTALIPAAVIIVLSLFKVKVKMTMTISILSAVVICIFVQKLPVLEILRLSILGFKAKDLEVSNLLSGGGVVSMIKVSAIVCLSCSFSGMFEGTGMLLGIKSKIQKLGEKMPSFFGVLLVSVFTCMISCNQTLGIILTNQLTDELEPSKEKRAIHLENAPVIIAPLIPWCIAGAVPISILAAPKISLLLAVYLYLVPIVYFVFELSRFRKHQS